MPTPTPPRGAGRLVLVALVAMAVVGVLLGWLIKGGGGRRDEAAGARSGGVERDLGPSAGRFGRPGRRTGPSASDVLGALGGGAPRADLLRVEGHVVDALTREMVGDVEVVFAGPAGETSAAVGADGSYQIDVAPGEYRAYVRGDHVISVGPAPYERFPTAPDPTAASAPDDQLAPMLAVKAAQRGVDLEVQRSGTVMGKVLDHTGRPIGGAVVRAELGGWRPILGTHIAETDADGTYRLEVPAGFYELSAAHADFAGVALATDLQRPSLTVFPAMQTELDLTMASGCVITGRAIHRDGSPVGAGALERGYGDTSYPAGPVLDDGSFRFTTVIEEEVTLRTWPWKSPPAPFQTISCRAGGRHVVEFVIPDDPPDLGGRIVDATGAPAPLAYVDVYGLTPGTMNQQERADGNGEWGVYALPDGEYTVTAHVPGLGIARAHVTVPAAGVLLRLGGTGSLSGRVDGLPDGATFQLEIAGCDSRDGTVVMPSTTRLVPVTSGAYKVDGLPACGLIASARSPARSQMIQVEIRAGGDVSFDLDLSAPRTKTVRLHVMAPDGSPVIGAQAMAMSMSGGAPAGAAATTDSRGDVTIDARVGDQITVFTEMHSTGTTEPLMGAYEVTDAPGSTEDADLRLMQVTMYDP